MKETKAKAIRYLEVSSCLCTRENRQKIPQWENKILVQIRKSIKLQLSESNSVPGEATIVGS